MESYSASFMFPLSAVVSITEEIECADKLNKGKKRLSHQLRILWSILRPLINKLLQPRAVGVSSSDLYKHGLGRTPKRETPRLSPRAEEKSV